MNLTTLESGNKTVKYTTFLALFYCVIITLAFIIALLYQSSKITDVTKNMLVIDTKGQLYDATTTNSSDARIFEYENHIKMFYTYWYSFDENTFKEHIEKGLYLIGEKGKELLNEYVDLGVERSLSEKNLRYDVQITDISIDMNTVPASGYIEGIQTGRRAKGLGSRKLCVKFTLYDVARSRTNIHGCKIDNWEIYESSIINENK